MTHDAEKLKAMAERVLKEHTGYSNDEDDVRGLARYCLSRIEADAGARNWDEDRAQENGNYTCLCGSCGNRFIGNKHRVVCRLCSIEADAGVRGAPDHVPHWLAPEVLAKQWMDAPWGHMCARDTDILCSEILSRQPAAEAGAWRTMESAPKDGTEVDLWCEGKRHPNCRWGRHDSESEAPFGPHHWRGTAYWKSGIGFTYPQPTHWQALPSPPPADAGGEPGIGWEMSDECKRDLAQMENDRMAGVQGLMQHGPIMGAPPEPQPARVTEEELAKIVCCPEYVYCERSSMRCQQSAHSHRARALLSQFHITRLSAPGGEK